MKYGKRFIAILVILLVAILLLTGCSDKFVKLTTESEMKEYVQENFGNAQYLRSEKDDDSITYYFQDEQLGFEYYVMSFKFGVGLGAPDASVLWYEEKKFDNFYGKYVQAIIIEAGGIYLTDDIYLELSEFLSLFEDEFAELYITREIPINSIITATEAFSSKLRSIDNRGILKNRQIVIHGLDNCKLGKYNVWEQKYISIEESIEEENMLYFAKTAEDMMGLKNVTITKVEIIPSKLVPGFRNEKIAGNINPEDNISCYYFTVDGIDYFITNAWVMYGTISQEYIYNLTENRSMVPELTNKN